jgi:hypothetical protein
MKFATFFFLSISLGFISAYLNDCNTVPNQSVKTITCNNSLSVYIISGASETYYDCIVVNCPGILVNNNGRLTLNNVEFRDKDLNEAVGNNRYTYVDVVSSTASFTNTKFTNVTGQSNVFSASQASLSFSNVEFDGYSKSVS